MCVSLPWLDEALVSALFCFTFFELWPFSAHKSVIDLDVISVLRRESINFNASKKKYLSTSRTRLRFSSFPSRKCSAWCKDTISCRKTFHSRPLKKRHLLAWQVHRNCSGKMGLAWNIFFLLPFSSQFCTLHLEVAESVLFPLLFSMPTRRSWWRHSRGVTGLVKLLGRPETTDSM